MQVLHQCKTHLSSMHRPSCGQTCSANERGVLGQMWPIIAKELSSQSFAFGRFSQDLVTSRLNFCSSVFSSPVFSSSVTTILHNTPQYSTILHNTPQFSDTPSRLFGARGDPVKLSKYVFSSKSTFPPSLYWWLSRSWSVVEVVWISFWASICTFKCVTIMFPTSKSFKCFTIFYLIHGTLM